MKKVLAFLLAIMLLAGSAAMAEEAEQELYYLRGWGIGGDTQGPVTGWVGDLWAEKGFQLEADRRWRQRGADANHAGFWRHSGCDPLQQMGRL